ncbi:MAG TPA: N-acetylneuraminate synthase family protein [Vicinamibacteria bacterium]|jgi:N,N'-diacetyllegionaminate synthase|nr:N-acetylneuraminate synthase family protein [Vicinamibacteria bacterium]
MRGNVLTIGTRQVGAGNPCFVLAEVASAHGGSLDKALKMLEAAFKMGADGIKFQIFRADDLVVRRHPSRKDFEQIELSEKEWKKILRAAGASGLALLVEAFDRPSLDLAAAEGAEAFKIHTTDMENPAFIRAVGAVSRPVLFATGGVAEAAVREALDLVGACPVGLLHGFQTFPTPIEEIHFRELAALRERYGLPVGFLDHTDGGSAFALVAPALAVAYGADLVEKHFTLDRTEKGFDYQSSLNPEDFYRMVELLRQAERARGDGPQGEGEGAKRYHKLMARSIVAGALIPRGEVLTSQMLAFKRTDIRFEPGFAPRDSDRVIGRRATRPIQADETIREDMLE